MFTFISVFGSPDLAEPGSFMFYHISVNRKGKPLLINSFKVEIDW